jgi:hypothetical protein
MPRRLSAAAAASYMPTALLGSTARLRAIRTPGSPRSRTGRTRKLYDVYEATALPLAKEALERIA